MELRDYRNAKVVIEALKKYALELELADAAARDELELEKMDMTLPPLNEVELKRYFEILALQRPTDSELIELQELASRFQIMEHKRLEAERISASARTEGAAKAKAIADKKSRYEAELLHQVSWLKNHLNPKIDDDALLAKWVDFRASVE